MNVFLADLGKFIDSWGWLLILCGGSAIANGIARVLDGRRKRAVLQVQLEAEQKWVGRLEDQLESALESSGGKSTKFTKNMVKNNSVMFYLLSRVQATDQAYPQLPQELRDELDRILLRYRVTTTDLEDHSSV
jgi:hypothetical protein